MCSPPRSMTACHRSVTGAALMGLAMCVSRNVHAETTTPPPSAARAEATGSPVSESYAVPLTLAYVLAPALAGAVGAGLFEITNTADDDITLRRNVAIAAGTLMFALPAAVHLYHVDTRRALRSVGSMLGVTLAGAGVLGGLGYLFARTSCEDTEEESCDVAIAALTAIGAATGAGLGYVGYAIYDVISDSDVPEPAPAASLQVWLAPIAHGPRGRAPRLGGVQIGGALSF
jgi:hypothetical protein